MMGLKEDLRNLKKATLDFYWDDKDKTIRGSSTNWTITMVYLNLIILGCFNTSVMERLIKLSDLMLFFFATSLGIWQTGRYLKYSKDKDVEVGIKSNGKCDT